MLPLLAALASTAIAQSDEAGLRRYHGGRFEALALDGSRLALRCRADLAADQLLANVRDRDIDGVAVTAVGGPGWHLLSLATPRTAVSQVRTAIERALQADGVQFAAPVFHGFDGHFATITPDLLLRATGDHAANAAAVLHELVPGATVIDPWFGRMPGALRAHSAARDGLQVLAEANRLAVDARIAWAEPDWLFSGSSDLVPNDPGWGDLWGLLNDGSSGGTPDMDMDADLAWDLTTGDAAVRVLVIDVGVEQTHPDIHQAPGDDFTGQSGGGGPVNACDKHGTPVAGCISAVLGNALGTAGIAPACTTVSARTFVATTACNGGWTSQASWTVDALAFGVAQGVRVTNNSNGYGFSSAAIESEYESTYAAGTVHFASAGNNSSPTASYPASLPHVNAIASIQRTGTLSGFSNYGADIAYAAPGSSIYSTDRTGADGYGANDYAFVSGTSFASPYAAGVAALVLSQTPGLTAPQVELALRATRDLGATGFDTTFGWGLVNANSALRAIPYGTGLAGTGGVVPVLFAGGLLRVDHTITVQIERALGGTVGVYAFGPAPASVPLFGGTLLVAAPWSITGFVLGGTAGAAGEGAVRLEVFVPNDPALVGSHAWLQSLIFDGGAVAGFAWTNGLELHLGA